jgi:NDP-sugar pyrophosphorylase family protein
MNRNIIILAGGASSRMKKSVESASVDGRLVHEAKTKAKAMVAVGNDARPFLDYLLLNVEKAGYENVVIVVGETCASVRDYYEREGKASQFPRLKFSYVVQQIPTKREKPLGTADALLQALNATPSWTGQRFTVCNSDNLYSATALKLLLEDEHDNAMIDYDSAGLEFSEERVAQFAIIKKDGGGFLQGIVEKPSLDELNRERNSSGRIGVSMNIWRFSFNDVLPYLKTILLHPVRQEKELPVVVQNMVMDLPRSVFTIPLAEHVVDLTSLADIPFVQEYLRREFSNF